MGPRGTDSSSPGAAADSVARVIEQHGNRESDRRKPPYFGPYPMSFGRVPTNLRPVPGTPKPGFRQPGECCRTRH